MAAWCWGGVYIFCFLSGLMLLNIRGGIIHGTAHLKNAEISWVVWRGLSANRRSSILCTGLPADGFSCLSPILSAIDDKHPWRFRGRWAPIQKAHGVTCTSFIDPNIYTKCSIPNTPLAVLCQAQARHPRVITKQLTKQNKS